ncbi:unnamed protein product [Gadus morhua 'NCC']
MEATWIGPDAKTRACLLLLRLTVWLSDKEGAPRPRWRRSAEHVPPPSASLCLYLSLSSPVTLRCHCHQPLSLGAPGPRDAYPRPRQPLSPSAGPVPASWQPN